MLVTISFHWNLKLFIKENKNTSLIYLRLLTKHLLYFLESSTYEVFERDPVKYAQYLVAIQVKINNNKRSNVELSLGAKVNNNKCRISKITGGEGW